MVPPGADSTATVGPRPAHGTLLTTPATTVGLDGRGSPSLGTIAPKDDFGAIGVDQSSNISLVVNRWIALGAALAAVVALSGCGKTDQAATTTPSAGGSSSGQPAATTSTSNPYGVPSIDPPAPDEPILTVTGGATPLSLTMDQLNALGTTTITVDEPFVKKRQTFSGVPLGTVLAKAGIPNSATIDTVALNAYHYSNVARPMIASSALIATKRDNAAIPYDQGGPIRLVYPDGSPLSSVLDAWNWSLESIKATSPSPGTP